MGSQVMTAYKGERGYSPLPFHQRAFTSFKYGGKDIEEFNLLVVFGNGDKGLVKDLIPNFTDGTATYGILDGQTYFYTTYSTQPINFFLMTDGITEQDLTNFTRYFRPGIKRELILSEHPNRAIQARLSSLPKIQLIPFESREERIIFGKTFQTLTTEYKGSIEIDLVADNPFWAAKTTFFKKDDLDDEEAIKIIYEDGIPYEGAFDIKDNIVIIPNKVIKNNVEIGNTFNIKKDETVYLYYCGTARSQPILKFTQEVKIDNDYIIYPKNIHGNEDKEFSYIQIGDNKLVYSLNGYLGSYNRAIKIIKQCANNTSVDDILFSFREKLTDSYMRDYAIKTLLKIVGDEIVYQSSYTKSFIIELQKYLPKKIIATVNCKNGEVNVDFDESFPLEYKYTHNSGDMLMSNYIIIEPKDISSSDKIVESDCLEVTCSDELTDVSIDFDYLYM